jgi:hypothetical protein
MKITGSWKNRKSLLLNEKLFDVKPSMQSSTFQTLEDIYPLTVE